MQIDLTFRNNPRNVKRRVLHKLGSRMCYITGPRTIAQRLLRDLVSGFNGSLRFPGFVASFGCQLDSIEVGSITVASIKVGSIKVGFLFFLGCLHDSRTASFCFSFGHVARYAPSRKAKTYGTIAENSSQANL